MKIKEKKRSETIIMKCSYNDVIKSEFNLKKINTIQIE